MNISVIELSEREEDKQMEIEVVERVDVKRLTRAKRGEFIELICCLLPCILPFALIALVCYVIYVYAFNNGDWGVLATVIG